MAKKRLRYLRTLKRNKRMKKLISYMCARKADRFGGELFDRDKPFTSNGNYYYNNYIKLEIDY